MSLALIQKLIISLGQIMAYAVRHRYIDHNPVREAEKPKGQGKEKENRINVLNPNQIKSLLGRCEGPEISNPYHAIHYEWGKAR